MATKKTVKTTTYTVIGRLHVDVGVDIESTSFAEAVEKSKELKIADFVDILGEHQDSSAVEIRSVWINDDKYL